jgi:hypothetical protein
MRGDRHDVDSEIVLPAGMELVVPPAAGPTTPAAAGDRVEPEHEASGDTQARRTDDASSEERLRRPAA